MTDLVNMLVVVVLLWVVIFFINIALNEWCPMMKPAIRKFVSQQSAYWILVIGPFFISHIGAVLFVSKKVSSEVQAGIFATAASISVAAFFEVKRLQREIQQENKAQKERECKTDEALLKVYVLLILVIQRVKLQLDSAEESLAEVLGIIEKSMEVSPLEKELCGEDWPLLKALESLLAEVTDVLVADEFSKYVEAQNAYSSSQIVLESMTKYQFELKTKKEPFKLNDWKEGLESLIRQLKAHRKMIDQSCRYIKKKCQKRNLTIRFDDRKIEQSKEVI